MGTDSQSPSALRQWLIGIVCVLAFALLLAGLWPVFSPRRRGLEGKSGDCAVHLLQMAEATHLYAENSDGRLPDATRWQDQIPPGSVARESMRHPFAPDSLHCPGVSAFGYAFNRGLSQAPLASLEHPENLPLIYDSSNLVANANDNFASLPIPARHGGKNIVVYANGRFHTLPPGN